MLPYNDELGGNLTHTEKKLVTLFYHFKDSIPLNGKHLCIARLKISPWTWANCNNTFFLKFALCQFIQNCTRLNRTYSTDVILFIFIYINHEIGECFAYYFVAFFIEIFLKVFLAITWNQLKLLFYTYYACWLPTTLRKWTAA